MNQQTATAAQIAELVKGELKGNPEVVVSRVSSLKDADAQSVSFVGNKKYVNQLDETKAGIVLVNRDLADASTEKHTVIVCENVDYAFTQVIALFGEKAPAWPVGIHPRAVVDPTAKIGANVSIAANAVIDAGAEIADGACIGAGCYVGHDAKIGEGTILYPNVTVMYRCRVGKKCIIHPGVVIGADGFGFVPGPNGLVKVPQTGIVQIDDDVEIGANTTIDRARFDKTWIKSNVKIDNQVMVAHNVVVGESAILVAQCGIAGSSEIGRGAILAAKVGINGHISIGDGCKIAGCSAVQHSMEPGSIAVGIPAESQRQFIARLALPQKMEKLAARVKALEEKN